MVSLNMYGGRVRPGSGKGENMPLVKSKFASTPFTLTFI